MDLKVVRNDITNVCVDAIVLPANRRLKEGSGASKAIFEKAGREELVAACKRYTQYNNKIEVGSSVPTRAYGLNAEYILHTVVPKWKDGKHQEYELLSAAYLSALKLADDMNCKTIAFPLLASGNNGYDFRIAWMIAKESIEAYVSEKKLKNVFLVIYDQEIMLKMKALGVDVEENIDTSYTIENDELHVGQLEKTFWSFLDTGKEMGEEFLVKICDPDVQRDLIQKGTNIVFNVMKKKIEKEMAEKYGL